MIAESLVPASADAAIAAVTWIVSLCCALTSAEVLLDLRNHADDGLLGWPVAQTRRRALVAGLSGMVADLIFRYPVFLALVATRLIAALMIVTQAAPTTWMPGLVLHLAITSLLLAGRTSFGMDGADQKSTLILLALGIATLVPTSTVKAAALWFITAQLTLSYVASGLAKIPGPQWRSGAAVWGVLATRMYGVPAVGVWLKGHPRLCAVLSWSVILSEVSFACVLVAPDPLAWALIGGGAAFHAATAVLMGLNTFLWAFLAAYPALIWCRFG